MATKNGHDKKAMARDQPPGDRMGYDNPTILYGLLSVSAAARTDGYDNMERHRDRFVSAIC